MKTTTRSTRNTRKSNTESWFGAGLAFVAFLFSGAIPAIVYGGYLGLILSNIIFGRIGDAMLATRCMTGAGMLVGLVATLSLYLLLGAGLGRAVGAAYRKFAPVEAPAAHAHR